VALKCAAGKPVIKDFFRLFKERTVLFGKTVYLGIEAFF